MTAPTLSTLPDAPSRSDDGAAFSAKADAHVASLANFVDQANQVVTWIQEKISSIEEDATDASASASQALDSKQATEALFDQFGDQYLGPHANDPAADNDGDPLDAGDIYFNTNDGVLKFYSGSEWVAPEDVASTAASNALASEQAAALSQVATDEDQQQVEEDAAQVAADRIVVEQAKADAVNAAQAAGVDEVYENYSQAEADLGSLSNGDVVLVLSDENYNGDATFYVVSLGSLNYRLYLPSDNSVAFGMYGMSRDLDFEVVIPSDAFSYTLGKINIAEEATIDWGDGTVEASPVGPQSQPSHTYATAGHYRVKMYGGRYLSLNTRDTGDSAQYIKRVNSFGQQLNSLNEFAFNANVDINPTLPNNAALTRNINIFKRAFAARSFNQPVNNWNMTAATNCDSMFKDSDFNQAVDQLYMPNLTTALQMFDGTPFNQSCPNLIGGNVNTIRRMFRDTPFDQDISQWDVSGVTTGVDFLDGGQLSTANYDALLIGWEAQPVQDDVTISFGNSQYTAGGAAEAARTALINDHGWIITDGGAA